MIKIGQTNVLKVDHLVDFGVYLSDGPGQQVLLPSRYIDEPLEEGQEIEVFVYNDSENRPIATTERPFAQVGECAYLQVRQVTSVGAFMDWGIPTKDLLVPFREQKERMEEGGIYLVYVYLDHASGRVAASAKVEKFIGNVLPHYQRGDNVRALIVGHTPGLGYPAIVDNLHWGMFYETQLFHPLTLQETIDARVHSVREDGKLDLTAGASSKDRSDLVGDNIMEALRKSSEGYLPYGDNSDPEAIRQAFGCSKKDFKKAVGNLYRRHQIIPGPTSIELAKPRRQH